MLWYIWKNHNVVVIAGKRDDLRLLVEKARDETQQWFVTNTKQEDSLSSVLWCYVREEIDKASGWNNEMQLSCFLDKCQSVEWRCVDIAKS